MSRSLLLLAAFLLAACSQDREAAPAATSASTGAPAAATEPCPEPEYRPLPEGISLGQPYLVRGDRVYVTRAGAERRRASLELLEGDPVAAAESIVAQYEAQGFNRLEVPERDDGIVRYAVRKGGVGRVNISASSDRGRNPSHPRSVGVVAVDWEFAPAPEAPGAGPAADGDDAEENQG